MLPLFLDDKKFGLNKSEMRDFLVSIEFSQIKSHHASHTSMSFFSRKFTRYWRRTSQKIILGGKGQQLVQEPLTGVTFKSKWQIPENHHAFALFDSPKMGNLMITRLTWVPNTYTYCQVHFFKVERWTWSNWKMPCLGSFKENTCHLRFYKKNNWDFSAGYLKHLVNTSWKITTPKTNITMGTSPILIGDTSTHFMGVVFL